MSKKYTCLIVIILLVLFVPGCNSNSTGTDLKDIKYKVLIDKLESDSINATVYYESISLTGDNTKTFNWKNKALSTSEDVYYPTFSNIYPSKSAENLKKRLKLTESLEKTYGQLYFYGNCAQYDFFVFEGLSIGNVKWQLFFLKDGELKGLSIQKDEKEVCLDSYQITDDAVYLYSRSKNEINSDFVIYKIDTKSFDTEKIVVPIKAFNTKEMVVQFDKIFIHKDNLIISSEGIESISKNGSIILTYNLKTKKANTAFLSDRVCKVFPYEDGYLTLSSTANALLISKYNNEFKLLSSNTIKLTSKQGDLIIGARDYFFDIHDNKLYGSLSIDGMRNLNYLVVLDIPSSEVLYFAELYSKNPDYAKLYVKYYRDENGRNVDLDSY